LKKICISNDRTVAMLVSDFDKYVMILTEVNVLVFEKYTRKFLEIKGQFCNLLSNISEK
jgi:hypothetical protein